MGKLSIGISQYLMVERLIINVRVRRKISGHPNYAYKRHHGISTAMLEHKWGVMLDKEKHTLQSTSKDNVIPALKPLTWLYIIDFLSQRLCGMNLKFYTDTLFAKENSIVGNKCSQIFTYGGFLQANAMRYK